MVEVPDESELLCFLKARWCLTCGFVSSIRPILAILAVGVLVRFLVAPWTSCPYDMYPFYRASTNMLAGVGVYGHAMFSYPPLFPAVLYPFVYVLSIFMDPSQFGLVQHSMVGVSQMTGILVPFITHPAFNLVVKTPLILADLALGVVLYRFVKDVRDETWARRVLILWFLNPLVIWTSSVVGQFDVLPAMMTVIALISFYRKEFFVAGLALGLGAFFKVYPVYLVILYLILIVWLSSVRKFPFLTKATFRDAGRMIAGGILSLVIVLPFFLSSEAVFDFIFRRAGYSSYGGLNMWFLVPLVPQDAGLLPDILPTILGLSPFIFLIAIALTVFIAYRLRNSLTGKNGDILSLLVLGNVFVVTAILVTQPVTNPQHLLWLFPFLLLIGSKDGRWERKLYVLTVLGILYFVGLQSFHAFLYPTAVYTNAISVGDLNSAIQSYFTASGLLTRKVWVISSAMLGGLTLLTIFLPKKFDPVERVWRLLSRFRGRPG